MDIALWYYVNFLDLFHHLYDTEKDKEYVVNNGFYHFTLIGNNSIKDFIILKEKCKLSDKEIVFVFYNYVENQQYTFIYDRISYKFIFQ